MLCSKNKKINSRRKAVPSKPSLPRSQPSMLPSLLINSTLSGIELLFNYLSPLFPQERSVPVSLTIAKEGGNVSSTSLISRLLKHARLNEFALLCCFVPQTSLLRFGGGGGYGFMFEDINNS